MYAETLSLEGTIGFDPEEIKGKLPMSTALERIRKQVQLLAEETQEPWQRDHDEALKCFEAGQWIEALNFFFDQLMLLDTKWRSEIYRGQRPHDAAFDQLLGKVVPEWVRAASDRLKAVEELERAGYAVDGANDLRRRIADAKGMTTPDDEFFNNDKLVALRDAALEEHRRGETEAFERMDDAPAKVQTEPAEKTFQELATEWKATRGHT